MPNKPRLIRCPLNCKGLHSTGCGPNCIRTRNEAAFNRYRRQLRSEAIQPVAALTTAKQFRRRNEMTSFEEATQDLRESIDDFKHHLVQEDGEPEIVTRLRQRCDQILEAINSSEFEEVCW